MSLSKNYTFSKLQDERTIGRLFNLADEDLLQYTNDVSKAYREGIHRAYDNRHTTDDWSTLYCKVQGFWLKLRGKKKAEFITVGIKPNAGNGILTAMSKNNAEVYEDIKPGGLTIEQVYVDLREGFTVIRTIRSWVCLYQTPAKETYALIVNRDAEPDATIMDLLLLTRSQQGIKNYGFSE